MAIDLIIVDDAPFVIDIVKQLTSGTEIQIVGEAVNGKEAVRLVMDLSPDVILMDIVMPVQSGLDASIEILAQRPNAKIIITSSIKKNNMILKALDSGCCEYLVKPFDKEGLVEAIRSAHNK